MNILAVDPGGSTGLATYLDGKHRAWWEPLVEAQVTVHNLVAAPGLDLCVFESFHITQATIRKSRDGADAIEFIGVGRYLARCYGVPFETQSPAEAKSFSDNGKLRAFGWYTPSDHARDASRHLLLALVRHGQVTDLSKLIPE